ncbi:Gfo/Idh/MocA family oxidoreductase [Candidatus Bipolaricaulota bacterium]|nr:Gfo/Idh/MocA family oxidoreductase [Candidatus Bipolaricaulota bacterium]
MGNVENVAVIGAGKWGKYLVRNFSEILGQSNVTVCDSDQEHLEEVKRDYKEICTSRSCDEVIDDESIPATVIATPGATHFELTERALRAGKHVLVERPLTQKVSDAVKLVELARDRDTTLMVDHLLEYHSAVEVLREKIDSGELGDIYYVHGQRLDLEDVETEEDILWSLGSQEVSLMLYLVDKEPKEVTAHGGRYLERDEGKEDTVFLTVEFEDGVKAHSHLSWLDPHKTRRMTVVGSKKMATFDDMESRNKLWIFDKGAEKSGEGGFNVRYGDVHIPNVSLEEPMKKMCRHFLESFENGTEPRSDGEDGLEVLKVLDAARRSLKNGGKPTIVMNVEVE